MGTIIKRKRKDGSTAWLAQIAIRRAGRTVFRENRTFERRSIAAAWLEKREKDLAKPGALDDVRAGDHKRRDVNGILNASFDVTGNRRSSKAFVNSMYGTASIKMTDGRIATSLLDLAGLGIFPWLFSTELANGYTDIVCVSAPLRIDAGKVTLNPLVAETRKVQVVAVGNLDLRKDEISLIAEPRPVGRPWARTAWPFGISGSLSKPEFKIRPKSKLKQTDEIKGRMPADRKPCVPDARQLE